MAGSGCEIVHCADAGDNQLCVGFGKGFCQEEDKTRIGQVLRIELLLQALEPSSDVAAVCRRFNPICSYEAI